MCVQHVCLFVWSGRMNSREAAVPDSSHTEVHDRMPVFLTPESALPCHSMSFVNELSLSFHSCHLGVSINGGYPQIIHFSRIFHCKPSIVGYPNFRKPQNRWNCILGKNVLNPSALFHDSCIRKECRESRGAMRDMFILRFRSAANEWQRCLCPRMGYCTLRFERLSVLKIVPIIPNQDCHCGLLGTVGISCSA